MHILGPISFGSLDPTPWLEVSRYTLHKTDCAIFNVSCLARDCPFQEFNRIKIESFMHYCMKLRLFPETQ